MKIYISGKISGTNLTETRKRFSAVARQQGRVYRALYRYQNRNAYNV